MKIMRCGQDWSWKKRGREWVRGQTFTWDERTDGGSETWVERMAVREMKECKWDQLLISIFLGKVRRGHQEKVQRVNKY